MRELEELRQAQGDPEAIALWVQRWGRKEPLGPALTDALVSQDQGAACRLAVDLMLALGGIESLRKQLAQETDRASRMEFALRVLRDGYPVPAGVQRACVNEQRRLFGEPLVPIVHKGGR